MSGQIKKVIITASVGVLLIILAPYAAKLSDKAVTPKKGAHAFATVLDRKTEISIASIQQLKKDIDLKGVRNVQLGRAAFLHDLFTKEGISIFVFRNDSLSLWSHNSLSPHVALQVSRRGTEIHMFDNGWYRLVYLTDGIDEFIAAILIKNKFKQSNKYLISEFKGGFGIPSLNDIGIKAIPGWVKLKADHQFFYLKFSEASSFGYVGPLVFLLVSLAGGLLIVVAIILLLKSFKHFSGTGLFILSTTVIFILRIWSLHAGWPAYISRIQLFDPAIYASSKWYPSLADFAINNLLLAAIALLVRFLFLNKNETITSWQRYIAHVLLLALLFAFAAWINVLAKGLVLNSNIPFEIDNITGLNTFSFVAIPALALLFLAFVLLADTIAIFTKRCRITLSESFLTLGLALCLYILITHLVGIRDLLFVLWPALILAVITLARNSKRATNLKLIHITAIISIFAVISAHNFIKYNATREHNQKRILAEKLATNNDPVAELLFTELKPLLLRDQNVKKLFLENDLHTRQILEDYVIPRYFSGYWSKYEITMYVYQADGGVWGKLPNVMPMPLGEIKKNILENGEPSGLDDQLYYMMRSTDLVSYITLIPLHYSLSGEPDGYFAFEFNSKLYPQYIGFPALLIDETSGLAYESSPYASAVYINGNLARTRGSFEYQKTPVRFLKNPENNFFVQQDGMEHLVSRVNTNTVVVISKEVKTFVNKASTFSYLCAVFALLFILARFVTNIYILRTDIKLNLNQRIQLLLVLLTLASMILFALATRYYIEQQYTEKNKRLLGEKIQSVLLEVKNKLEDEYELDYSQADYINRLLSHFSSIFFTDINLYSPQGDLLASSQMRMFNEGLISRKINPETYANLHYLGKIEFIHEEEIGDLKYISAYVPFYNKNGDLLAYLNLPYFGRQALLDQEISNFLVAVVNVFVLLLILSVFVGLFMSQWITAPLRIIRESLSQMDPGKSNKLIDYSSPDEIGLLVAEYNSKVAELENNAEQLAQSERESAWREMAKQVAHEIKNPLTPMKLSVQHLQRYIEKGEAISNEQILKTAHNLNEQIDALSAIATAFSNFARMPQARYEVIDLLPVLETATSLFEHVDRVKITLELNELHTAKVKADKEQLLRVFNNLIKNALQSIPNARQGRIEIRIIKLEESYQISINDNGTGIADEARSKIFVPNFTTKSHGMGLGLAMTKNIVENSGGKIWFESSVGSGSTFFVNLPFIE